MDGLAAKKQCLEEYLKDLGGVLVAFSSGVDSTFLLKVAHDVLGERAAAVTVRSCLFPKRETDEAAAFCKAEGIEQVVLEADELCIEGFCQNPKNRCYLCKRDLFSKLLQAASQKGLPYVVEGSNLDDEGDYRPGMVAVAELGIKSPLRKAGLTKEEIRVLSRRLGLPTWDKPSYACLASRFVYGEEITREKLSMVDRAEQMLLDLGFRQVRVRIHGNLARIEVERPDFPKMLEKAAQVNEYLHGLGFLYVSLDLGGYQTGSMNRAL